jgi:DNA-binding transcriptional regulator YiaG
MTVNDSMVLAANDAMVLARLRADVISGRVRQIREQAHLSQPEIAHAIGTSSTAVSQWEAGRRMPRGPAALRYAALLDELDKACTESGRDDAG